MMDATNWPPPGDDSKTELFHLNANEAYGIAARMIRPRNRRDTGRQQTELPREAGANGHGCAKRLDLTEAQASDHWFWRWRNAGRDSYDCRSSPGRCP